MVEFVESPLIGDISSPIGGAPSDMLPVLSWCWLGNSGCSDSDRSGRLSLSILAKDVVIGNLAPWLLWLRFNCKL